MRASHDSRNGLSPPDHNGPWVRLHHHSWQPRESLVGWISGRSGDNIIVFHEKSNAFGRNFLSHQSNLLEGPPVPRFCTIFLIDRYLMPMDQNKLAQFSDGTTLAPQLLYVRGYYAFFFFYSASSHCRRAGY